MAKKDDDRPHASKLRHGSRSPAELRKEAGILKAQAGELESLANDIETKGIKRVKIDGDRKFTNGTELIWGFIAAVSTGLIKSSYGR